MSIEVNFDGLIGPTHNFGGLSFGNIASASHAADVSYPRAAALQGLAKMRLLLRKGYSQGFLLPQRRPDLEILGRFGFSGDLKQRIGQAAAEEPALLRLVYSASSMWAANAATVTPSADAPDGRLHFTPANLVTTAHRAIEAGWTRQCLATVFSDDHHFVVHPPLPPHPHFGDEGAANHNRLCTNYGDRGVGLFVYGAGDGIAPEKYPARQTLLASRAVARQHQMLYEARFLQQHPAAIDAGAFHNDVVAVSNGPVLFFHEQAFLDDPAAVLGDLVPGLKLVCVPAEAVSLQAAISSYLFNSQLLASPAGDMDQMLLLAPRECFDEPSVRAFLAQLVLDQSQPIRAVEYVDVRQSMSNGGGPACLRLRVVMTQAELAAMDQRFLLDETKLDRLVTWVNDCYRETLAPADLVDPVLARDALGALAALQDLLGLDDYYRLGGDISQA